MTHPGRGRADVLDHAVLGEVIGDQVDEVDLARGEDFAIEKAGL
jgi:hypothetical protein